MDITCLGIDTNVLIGERWPTPSVDLSNVVIACAQLGIPVFLPELVLWEAETVWLEKTRKAIEEAQSAMRVVAARLMGMTLTAPTFPDRTAYTEAYAKTVATLQGEWKWQAVPLPAMDLREAALRSARHEPPFASTDIGFRDTLILLSLLNRVDSGAVLGLVTADNPFIQRAEQAASTRRVTLSVFRTPREAWGAIQRMVKASAMREQIVMWQRLSERLQEAVQADREHLDAFIRENLRVPENPYGVPGYVHAVQDLRTGDITAHTGYEDKTRATVTVSIVLVVVLQMYRSVEPRVFHVGETAPSVSPLFEASTGPTLSEIEGTAEIDAQVQWAETETPVDLKYLNVKFRTEQENEMMRQALIDSLEGRRRK